MAKKSTKTVKAKAEKTAKQETVSAATAYLQLKEEILNYVRELSAGKKNQILPLVTLGKELLVLERGSSKAASKADF